MLRSNPMFSSCWWVSGLVLLAAVVLLIDAASTGTSYQARSRPRVPRGFKQAALSTARGFGKRGGISEFGLLSDEASQLNDEQSVPAEWYIDELENNLLARLIQKLIDWNREGELSKNGLLTPLYAEEKPEEELRSDSEDFQTSILM